MLEGDGVYYLGNDSPFPNHRTLFEAPGDGSSQGVAVAALTPGAGGAGTGANALALEAGYGKVLISMTSAGAPTKGRPMSYTPPAALDGSGVIANLATNGNANLNVTSLHAPPFTFGGFSSPLFFDAEDRTAGAKDLYFLPAINASSADKISHIDDGSGGGGRFRVRLMGYEGAGGSISLNGTSIDSACLFNPAQADGQEQGTALYVPAGPSGGENPFVVALEVYPNASDCSGTPEQVLFTDGINQFGSSPEAARLFVTTSGANSKIFLSD